MKEKYQILRWKFLKIDLEKKHINKVLQYFCFASLSILLGYSINKPKSSSVTIWALLGILPSLYIINFLYFQTYHCISKYILPQITWFEQKNRKSVVQSHFLILNVILIYTLYDWIFREVGLFSNNSQTLAILSIYSLVFFLHRSLEEIDKHVISESNYEMVSFLKYRAYEHVHVFAGTTIGLPCLLGYFLSNEELLWKNMFEGGAFSYMLFIFSWIALYQHKFKASHSLDSLVYIIPSAFYPIFPIIFYLVYCKSLAFFYVLFGLSMMMCLSPLIYPYPKTKSLLDKLTNQKTLLFISLIIINYIAYRGTLGLEVKLSRPILNYGYSGISSLFSIAGLVIWKKTDDELKRFQLMYLVLPYTVISIFHLILWIYCWFATAAGDIYLHVLSDNLQFIECAIVSFWIIVNLLQLILSYIKKGIVVTIKES